MAVLPIEVWQYPMIAGLLLVVGWLLYQLWQSGKGAREEREKAAAEAKREREQSVAFMEDLVRQSQEERQAHLHSWQEMVAGMIEVQRAVVSNLEQHEDLAERRHGEVVQRLERLEVVVSGGG